MKYKLLIILLITSSFLYICCTSNKSIQHTITNGNLIVKGLNNYFSENQKYPDNLDQLVPKYLEIIPKAKTNNFLLNRSVYVYRPYTNPIQIYQIKFYDHLDNKYYIYSSDHKNFNIDNSTTLPSNSEITIEIEKGQIVLILAALDQYFFENHQYPARIDILIPKYLDTIPFVLKENNKSYNSNSNKLFLYTLKQSKSPISNNEYELFFKYNLFDGYSYNSLIKIWKYFTTLI